jgi:hypothetical protein
MFTKSIVAVAVLLPVAVLAQPNDAKYCSDLSSAYRAYTNQIDPEVARAMGQCQSTPTAAIPVLEKHLKQNKVALPSRT